MCDRRNILIIKLGATGDVVRTTALLRRLDGEIAWITSAKNLTLLQGLPRRIRAVAWEQRRLLAGVDYDLVINLEDEAEISAFVRELRVRNLFGAYLDSSDRMRYTADSKAWFDLSLISTWGREHADELKLQNRRTYQELVFEGLGFSFQGERYVLPPAVATGLAGDVAIAAEAGAVWPMKRWAHYDALKAKLEATGLKVNVLGNRLTLLEHLADVQGHRLLVSGDTLPMHLALGSGVRCVTLFHCTSPWEIYEYGLQRKLISPLLDQFFYQRGFDERATTAIHLEEVFTASMEQLQAAGENGAAQGMSGN